MPQEILILRESSHACAVVDENDLGTPFNQPIAIMAYHSSGSRNDQKLPLLCFGFWIVCVFGDDDEEFPIVIERRFLSVICKRF